jgi:Zn-dependent peptidase ImmA (M78 family)
VLRRGFKAWCERIAEQYRTKLEVEANAPLCAWKLAEYLNVIVWPVDAIPDLPSDTLAHLTNSAKSSWSAATLFHNDKKLVILNSSHAKVRQSNDLMHELAHLICGHKPARVDISDDNLMILQSYDKSQEDEADTLAGVLLLPRVVLVHIKKQGLDTEYAASHYAVSKQLLTMRLNMSGVNKQYGKML